MIFSNIFYFIASIIALYKKKYIYGILLFLTIMSITYHINKKYLICDIIISIIILIYSLYYLYYTENHCKEKMIGLFFLMLMMIFLLINIHATVHVDTN